MHTLPYGDTAVNADGRRGENWSYYGTALFGAGDDTCAALTARTAAAERQPWQARFWLSLAIASAEAGNRVAALAAAERASRADPFEGRAHELIPTIAYDRGDFARAASEGERALVGYPAPQTSTYFTTVSAYVQLKDLDRAETLARAGAPRLGTFTLRLQLAAIVADRGKTAEAIAVLDALLRDDPRNVDAQRLRQQLVGR